MTFSRYVSADLWYFDEPHVAGKCPLAPRMHQRDSDGRFREYRRLDHAWNETLRRDMCEFRRQYEHGNIKQVDWDALRTRYNQAVHYYLYPTTVNQ